MLELLFEMFSYDFLLRAALVGSLVALCAALLGVSLVLKRYSMIGDGLSHVGFGALSVALAMNLAPLYVAVPVVVLAAFFLLRLSESARVRGDAAIAMISCSCLAIGVIAASLGGGSNVDVYGYLFGSVLAMRQEDVYISVVLSLLVLVLFIFFYNRLFAVTFDETFARATGINTGVYNMLLALLTALTIAVGMRLMGTMLISGLIVFPALSAMRLCRSFRGVIIAAALISVVCFLCGIVLSYLLSLPAGASVIVVELGVFLLCRLFGRR